MADRARWTRCVAPRIMLCFAVVVLLLPLLAACGVVPQSVAQIVTRDGGTLRLSGSSPSTLDPAVAQDVSSWEYLLQIYSGLVRLDKQLKVVPDIAQSWTVSPDGRTYTFALRSDARFQNGQPITASDIKYSLDRALDPATHSPVAAVYLGDIVGARARMRGAARDVSGIAVVNSHTLRITIDKPESDFLSKLTYPTAFVVNRQNVESGPHWFQHPIGSGPFELKTWVPHDQLVLVRNPNYYGKTPTLGEIDYYLGPDPPISLYRQGKLDVATVGIGDVARVSDPQGPYHNQLVTTPLFSLWYLGFNVHQKPFDDPKVRLAFAYATDKRKLINGLFQGSRTAANGILPPGMLGYDQAFAGIPYDPARARTLLAESSYKSAANLPPIVLTVGESVGQMAEGFAQMYHQNLGVNISVVQMQNGFFTALQQHQLQMFFLGWQADYPDPQDFLGVLFEGTSQANDTGYNNAEVNQILSQARTETDPQKRTALYRRAQAIVVQDAPVIPLYFDTEYDLVKPSVTGLTITPIGIVSFAGVRVQG